MRVTRIEACGFRNLSGSILFGPELNILYGDNAQGKTNWLEAVYVLGTSKSFRTAQLRDAVSLDSEQFVIRGECGRGSIERELRVIQTHSSKELVVNGKRVPPARYLGNLDVFVLSMEDLDVIRGEPSRRRRFIDGGVVGITPGFLRTLSAYNQVIRQKNKLLGLAREAEQPDGFDRQIRAWNDQLVELGAEIHNARVSYVARLNRSLSDRSIFGAERITLRYRSSLEGKGDLDRYADLLRERLALRLSAEIAAGHSLIGPHRDDLEILADSREVARFGSAGQQRSALIILDLAQVSIYNSVYDERPVLLIDDIDAELDRGRIEALLSALEGQTQTIVSTSRRAIANRYRDRSMVYFVAGGAALAEAGTAAQSVETFG